MRKKYLSLRYQYRYHSECNHMIYDYKINQLQQIKRIHNMPDNKDIDLSNLATLSQLSLSADDQRQLQQDMQQTLVFINQVANAEIKSNTSINTNSVQYLREDIVKEKEAISKVQDLSPNLQAGLFLVPQVVE